ncbi:hypothetical protein H0H87_001590 [Tephrocybe sp. NHM501043]|nr:hypothetical protein H0H87_001590 [Tephrocybe sp. NHM501043]
MQLLSLFERRRSTIETAKTTKVEVKEETATESTDSPLLFRSASLLRAKLSTRRVKRANSSRTSDESQPAYDLKKVTYLIPAPAPMPHSITSIDLKESRSKRKSESVKRVLRQLRSPSKEERREELVELARLLELKETESIQSVSAKRNPQVCSSWDTYRRSWEVEIIDPSSMTG